MFLFYLAFNFDKIKHSCRYFDKNNITGSLDISNIFETTLIQNQSVNLKILSLMNNSIKDVLCTNKDISQPRTMIK